MTDILSSPFKSSYRYISSICYCNSITFFYSFWICSSLCFSLRLHTINGTRKVGIKLSSSSAIPSSHCIPTAADQIFLLTLWSFHYLCSFCSTRSFWFCHWGQITISRALKVVYSFHLFQVASNRNRVPSLSLSFYTSNCCLLCSRFRLTSLFQRHSGVIQQ